MKGFEWRTRYSSTDEPDKHGRWARICYYNGLMIAWVRKIKSMDRYYVVSDYFPTIHNDIPFFVGGSKDFEELKKGVEERFINFLKIMNEKTNHIR